MRPVSFHVKGRPDSATIYSGTSIIRRAAPLHFDRTYEEVQVLVPLPKRAYGQDGFDRDSVQVHFGSAFDSKIIFSAMTLDSVSEKCLLKDGTVDFSKAKSEADSSDDVESIDEAIPAGVPKNSTGKYLELRSKYKELVRRVEDLDNAHAADTELSAFQKKIASSLVNAPAEGSSKPLAVSTKLLDTEMWCSVLDSMQATSAEGAKNDKVYNKEHRRLTRERDLVRMSLNQFESGYAGAAEEEEDGMVPVAVVTLKVLEAIPPSASSMIYVSYKVFGGSWSATYDAHLSTCKNEVTLYYNANVELRHGEDLHGVQLSLSTAAPRQNIVLPPSMSIWRCGIEQPAPEIKSICSDAVVSECAAAPPCFMARAAPMMMKPMAAVAESVGAGGTMNFTLPCTQTIYADGSQMKLPLTVLTLPAAISYVSVPSEMQAAFTHAKMRNTSEFLLTPGEVSVFIDGTFVTRSFLSNSCGSQGYFELDFGVDRGVDVKRVLLQKSTAHGKTSLLGKKADNVTTYTYKITIKNRKMQSAASGAQKGKEGDLDVKIKIQERIPVSSSDEIVVTLVSPPAPYKECVIFDSEEEKEAKLKRKVLAFNNEGLVEVERVVGSGKSVEVLLTFTVQVPNGKQIEGL